jgi:hypothetical protein
MSQYFMELGCKVNNPTEKEQADFKIPNKAVAAQRRVAKLKIPLDFPKVRMMPRSLSRCSVHSTVPTIGMNCRQNKQTIFTKFDTPSFAVPCFLYLSRSCSRICF